MKSIRLILFCAVLLFKNVLALNENGKLWAVLVAGSNEYYNYRHQADICHAYHTLHNHGIPDEQIIVMMYDDIAHNEENPHQGEIINHPNGANVYPGVPKDYVGNQVTPANFINVLLGNQEAMAGKGSGKVLKSGPDDHVFVYFSDHGAAGLVAFPNGELYVDDFTKTLLKMYNNKQYEKMVIYIEACESGSMFEKLPNNINIYATSASNAEESSYACYYDEERGTYLGDLYSVNWMEDSDKEDLLVETLNKQFAIIKAETNLSHVQHFGDMTIGKLHVGEFQGLKEVPTTLYSGDLQPVPFDAVPAPDVPMYILEHKMEKYQSTDPRYLELQRKLYKLHKNRMFLLMRVQDIVKKSVKSDQKLFDVVFKEPATLTNTRCHKDVVQYFSKNCFSLSKNDYALRHVYVLANLCDKGIKPQTIKKAMDAVCTHPPIYGIY